MKAFPESTPEDRAFITSEEGRIPFIYDDAVAPVRVYVVGTRIKGNLTAGVGHLISRGTKIVDPAAYKQFVGKKVIPATVIDQWLDDDLDVIEKSVANHVKVPLTPHQRGTLYSFGFNVGEGGFEGSGVLRKINAGKLADVPAELAKWNKTTINGVRVTSPGLIKRRALETAYWLGGSGPVAPVTKAPVQPKATEIAIPEIKKWSPTEIIGAGSTVATITGAGLATTGFLSYVFGGILIVAVLGIGALAVKRFFFSGR